MEPSVIVMIVISAIILSLTIVIATVLYAALAEAVGLCNPCSPCISYLQRRRADRQSVRLAQLEQERRENDLLQWDPLAAGHPQAGHDAINPLPYRRPVPQAIIDSFPIQLYTAPKLHDTFLGATAATLCLVDSANAPDQQANVGADVVVMISSGGNIVDGPTSQPLPSPAEAQGDNASVQVEDLESGLQAHADSTAGGAGHGRADTMGTANALGAALRRVGRALSGRLADADDSQSPSTHTCSICLCDYEGGDKLRQLPCLHSFHRPCIDAWMASNDTCPICRLDLNNKDEVQGTP